MDSDARQAAAAIHRDVAEQALWYVKQAISCMGFDPFDGDDEWQGFIESYGNAGAYLMSAQSTLEEAIRRVAA